MDWVTVREKGKQIFGKYKYVLLVLLLGILLMSIPPKQETTPEPMLETVPEAGSIAEELEQILSQIDGVGKVKVLLTESKGSQTVYMQDEDSTVGEDNRTIRLETVVISGTDRGEFALVQRTDPPVYLGAIIVCQGGDIPEVRLYVAQAVANVTGIGTDRVTVLKMK